MNLRAVVRKAKNGKFGGAGGYLAHVGVGHHARRASSSPGVYAKTSASTLPVNEPTKVAGSTLTFLRVVPGTADDEAGDGGPRRDAAGQDVLRVPEDVREQPDEPAHGEPGDPQLAALRLLHLAAVLRPGPARAGRARGPADQGHDARAIDGIGFTFRDFNADRSAMMQRREDDPRPDGRHDHAARRHDARRHAALRLPHGRPAGRGAGRRDPRRPGRQDESRSPCRPTTAPWSFGCTGVSKDPADEFQAATTESLSVDVTRKPLISLVWGGFYVMMAGAASRFVKRSREARKAVLAGVARAASCRASRSRRQGRQLPASTRARSYERSPLFPASSPRQRSWCASRPRPVRPARRCQSAYPCTSRSGSSSGRSR